MEPSELLEIFDREMRQEIQMPGTVREVQGGVIRTLIPDEHSGFIGYSRLSESTADEEINAQVRYFQSKGMWFEWKVYDHDRPADLRQRLQARGLVVEEPEALLALDLNHAPDFYWNMELPRIDRVTDPSGLEGIICLEDEVWGTDHAWMRTRMGNDLRVTPDQLSMFAVPADGRVVSAAWIYYHPPSQFASLWGGSTLSAYRKRGYYTALLAVRAREARQRGYRFLTVDASPMSRPILEKHGFQFLGFSTPCIWKPEFEKTEGTKNG